MTTSFGTPVRTTHGATGRYIKEGVVLYVSAQDNSICVDGVKEDGEPPWADSPLPTMEECYAFRMGLTMGEQLSVGRPEQRPSA